MSNERAPHLRGTPPGRHTYTLVYAGKLQRETPRLRAPLMGAEEEEDTPSCQRLGSGRVRLVSPSLPPRVPWTGPWLEDFGDRRTVDIYKLHFLAAPFIMKCFVQSQHWGVVTAMSPGQSIPPRPGLPAGRRRSAPCLPRPGHRVPGHPRKASLRLTYRASQNLCPQSS